jgi:small-conductance mechanosensitive channel
MTTLLDAMKANPDVLEDPEPYVLFMGFGDSSLDFEVRAWTDEFDFFQRVRSTACVDFEAALRRAGIVIPFPQRDLHIHAVQPGASKTSGSSAAKAGDDEIPQHPPPPDSGTAPDSSA